MRHKCKLRDLANRLCEWGLIDIWYITQNATLFVSLLILSNNDKGVGFQPLW